MAPINQRVKRRKINIEEEEEEEEENHRDWSNLDRHLLCFIISKLSFLDFICFRSVCLAWDSVSELYLSSTHSIKNPPSQLPLLLVPSHDPEYFSFYDAQRNFNCFINKHDSSSYEDCCIGSSDGWLVFVDNQSILYVLNPFSRIRINLPSISILYNELGISESYFVEVVLRGFFKKSIIIPDRNRGTNFTVVVISDSRTHGKLWFCKNEGTHWIKINEIDAKKEYIDILAYNDLLYTVRDDMLVEAWDLNGEVPVRRMSINPLQDRSMIDATTRYRQDLFLWNYYLVESREKILLVVRYVGYYVNSNNDAIYESDLLTKESTHPLVCPYKTLYFDVYELDFIRVEWIKVKSLGERVLFLGGNQGISLSINEISSFEENSIYYTDDNWDKVDEDDLYGGHDNGVFNLKTEAIKPHPRYDLPRISPPPLWIFPHY